MLVGRAGGQREARLLWAIPVVLLVGWILNFGGLAPAEEPHPACTEAVNAGPAWPDWVDYLWDAAKGLLLPAGLTIYAAWSKREREKWGRGQL